MELRKPPKDKDKKDLAREIGRATVSLVPFVGGPAQVLFENVIGPSLEKRRQQWLEDLAEVVEDLQRDVAGMTPEKLAENQGFITTIMQATQFAVRTHQEEKREALRNAVFNSAIPGGPDDDEQLFFLRLIDSFTARQIRLLAYLHKPRDWMDANGVQPPLLLTGSVANVIQHCMPELIGADDQLRQLVREFQAAGLVQDGDFLFSTQSGGALLRRETTNRGEAFLKYITRPPVAEAKK